MVLILLTQQQGKIKVIWVLKYTRHQIFQIYAISQIWLYLFSSPLYRAYDRAAIKFRGVDADINFSLSDYEEDMQQVRNAKI